MTRLVVRDLVVRRAGQGGRAVVDVPGLDVPAGSLVALVGPSGGGKSSLLGAVAGTSSAQVEGTLRLDGLDLGAPGARRATWGRRVGVVAQEAGASLDPRASVGAQLAEVLEAHRRPGDVADRLAEVGLDPGLAVRRPFELSGGQQQRVAVALALAGDPDLLVADEPTSALDPAAAAFLLDALDARRQRGLAVLAATHDRALVARADSVHAVRDGRLAPPDATLHPPRAPQPVGGPARLVVSGLAVRPLARGGRAPVVVRDVALDAPAGSVVALVGPSGSGKSTLARALVGLGAIVAGRATFDGADLGSLARPGPSPLRARVAWVAQEPALDPRWTLDELVVEALGAADPARVVAACDAVDLDPRLLGRRIGALSGGEAQRGAIVRALVRQPDLLVLDEPTSALDAARAVRLWDALRDHAGRHGAVVVVATHDAEAARHRADRVVRLGGA